MNYAPDPFHFSGVRVTVSPHMLPARGWISDHPLYAWWQRNVWRRKGYTGGFQMKTGAPECLQTPFGLFMPKDAYAALMKAATPLSGKESER